MLKVRAALTVTLAFGGAAAAAAAAPVAHPAARECAAGMREPAMLVRITGFKARTGRVRVQAYGGDPDRFFDKGTYLRRIEAAVPAAGPLDVCVALPRPGDYAVSVRHDLNGSGKSDRGDGGGMSGNPHLSLFDLMLKRKPDPAQVAVAVGRGVRTVPITLNYLRGGRFEPVAAEARN